MGNITDVNWSTVTVTVGDTTWSGSVLGPMLAGVGIAALVLAVVVSAVVIAAAKERR